MCKLLLKVLLYIVTCNGGSNGVTEIAATLLILKKRGEVGGRGGERENLIVRYSYTSIMNKVLLQSIFYKIFFVMRCISDFKWVFYKWYLFYGISAWNTTKIDTWFRHPYSCPEQFFANLHGIGLSEFKWWYTFIFSQSYSSLFRI